MSARLPSLRLAIPLLILAVGLAGVATIFLVEGRRSRELAERQLRREAVHELTLLSASIESSLRNRNPAAARGILAHAAAGPDLLWAGIVAEGGEVVFCSQLVDQGRPLSDTRLAGQAQQLADPAGWGSAELSVLADRNELLARQALVLGSAEGQLLAVERGQLALVYDLERRRGIAHAELLRRMGHALILLALVTLVLWAGLHHLVVRRLARVRADAQRVGAGETDLVPLAGEDEIAALSAEMARMARQVGEARQAQADQARRNAELQEQLHRVQRLESVGTLAAGVAHDFNNLLTVILGHAQLAGGRPGNPAASDEDLRSIRGAARRGRDVVQQLLDLSRESKAERTVIELGGVVHEALELVRSSFPSRVRVVESGAGEPLRVLANAGQLQQVLLNLATNSLQALGDHGGTLDTRLERVESAVPPGLARLVFRDDGPGMPPEVAARVFEPFFTTRDADRGTGLGLAVARGIVEQHGGKIRLDTAPGQGSCFTIDLPLAEGAPPDELTAPAVAPTNRSLRIVFVDDEAPVLAVLCRLARALGHHAVGFGDAREAEAALLDEGLDCDLLVSDYMMPGLDGQELLRRATAARPGLPALLVSGYGNLLSEAAAREAGALAVVLKPDFVRDMEGTLRRVMDEASPH